MRFAFIAGYYGRLALAQLCKLFELSPRGLRAWRQRPASQHQRDDMVILAHIRKQPRLSLGRYGRAHVTAELREPGLPVGERRVGRL